MLYVIGTYGKPHDSVRLRTAVSVAVAIELLWCNQSRVPATVYGSGSMLLHNLSFVGVMIILVVPSHCSLLSIH